MKLTNIIGFKRYTKECSASIYRPSQFGWIGFIFVSILFIFGLLFDKEGLFSIVSSLLVSIFMLVQFRRFKLLFIVLLLISFFTYSFLFGNYIGINDYLDYSFDTNGLLRLLSARITFTYSYLTYFFTLLFFRKIKNKNISVPQKNVKPNSLLTVLLLAVIIAIWILFYDFSFGTRAGYSPIYEYSTIFFIFAYYYAGNNKRLLGMVFMVAVFYIAFDFLGGQRSTGAQIGLISLLFLFFRKIKTRTIFVLFLIALIGMNFVAVFRGESGFDISSINVAKIINGTFDSHFSSDTASFAYYSSVVYLFVRTHFNFVELLNQFFQFAISQFIVGSIGESITSIALNYHIHYYGGVLPIYVYYYLGFFGVLLIALLTSFYFSIISRFNWNNKGFVFVFSIYITATCIRWFLYSPNQLLRGVFLLAVMFFVLKQVDRIMRNTNGSRVLVK